MRNNITPMFGQSRPARRTLSWSGLTRAGGEKKLRPVPEVIFANSPQLANVDPSKVTYVCERCGDITPFKVLIGQSERVGYLRRRCECEVREREEQLMSAFIGGRVAEVTKKNVAACYSWLGKGDEQRSLETKTFENFYPDWQKDLSIGDAYREMMIYASSLTQGQQGAANMLLTGPNGVGKTHLVCSIINLARNANVPCAYATAPHLFDALYATGFEHRPAFLLKVVMARVLVLDELDKLYVKRVEEEEDAGSYQRGILGEIMNGRYNKGLPTLIVTNEPGDVGKWLDRSARSRLRENMITLRMDGSDIRPQLRKRTV